MKSNEISSRTYLCFVFSDDVKFLCQNAPKTLQKLNLAGLRNNISDEDVLELVSKCNNLIELDLSDAAKLTEDSLSFIIAHLGSSLRKLSLSRCFNIHPVRLLNLIAMRELKTLNVYGLVSDDKLGILKLELPHLDINQAPLSFVARSASSDRRNYLWDVKLWQ